MPTEIPSDSLLVVILGPTGAGKTALSLVLAERFDGEIVNCDSVAMYREFEIGTAKPSAMERARVPHHAFDCVDPQAFCTAGEYARMAKEVLRQIHSRGKLPVLVGGTGLYLRALLEGLFAGPERSEELRRRLRASAEKKGSHHLWRILGKLDPATAARIHANDTPKLIRAIEVCLSSRQKMSEMWKQGREALKGFRVLRLGLNPDRQQLYQRINHRAQEMFSRGLVQETRQLLERYGDQITPMKSLGYKQAVQLIREELTVESAIAATQQAHRNYAKRQITWFRREPGTIWLEGFGDDPQIQRLAIEQVYGHR